MLKDTPPTIYLKDYTPPDYLIDVVDLEFDLGETFTRVKSQLRIRRNDTLAGDRGPLVLHGREFSIYSVEKLPIDSSL